MPIKDTVKYLLFSACTILLTTACEKQDTADPSRKMPNIQTSNTVTQLQDQRLQHEFQLWKEQQNQQLLLEYQRYLAQRLQHPPSLFELSYNRHISNTQCTPYQFAIAPRHQWENIVQPLQLIERLQALGIIHRYKIGSVYRGAKANQCSRGATGSKHLSKHAVDFQLISTTSQNSNQPDTAVLQKICQFWKQEGQALNMGLGTYQHNKFHIDMSGYRTWGQDYKSASSLCLKR